MSDDVLRDRQFRISGAPHLQAGVMRLSLLIAGFALAPALLAAQLPSITLYDRGTALVKREFPVEVAKGENIIDVRLEDVDPGTIFSTDPAIHIHSIEVRRPANLDEALLAAVGVELTFVTPRGDSLRATPVGPRQFRLADGRITYSPPGAPIFPAELAAASVQLRLHLGAESARHTLGLGYLVAGGNWTANYEIIVGRGPARVLGYVVVRGEWIGIDSAHVTLASGFQAPQPPATLRTSWRDPVSGIDVRGSEMGFQSYPSGVMSLSPPRGEGLGDGVLYELPSPVRLGPQRLTVVDLLDGVETPVEATLSARTRQTGFSWSDTRPDTLQVSRDYLVRRARGTPFGDRPFPAGEVRILALDSKGQPQLLSDAAIMGLVPGQDLVVHTIGARGVTVVRRYSDYQQVNPRSAFVTVTTEVTSSLDSAVALQLFDRVPSGTTITEHSHPFVAGDGDTIRFPLKVPARGSVSLRHLVRIDR